ncbi:MAG: hypothetical protein JWQ01_1819 [Massilia sp.]|jgi:hypothetical protein|nr:hypothetical protein [Massilia sp.]
MNVMNNAYPEIKPPPRTVLDDEFRTAGEAALLTQLERMISESGNGEEFDALQWLSDWLESSLPALGGAKPADYMYTVQGQERISDLLAMIQSGAYA